LISSIPATVFGGKRGVRPRLRAAGINLSGRAGNYRIDGQQSRGARAGPETQRAHAARHGRTGADRAKALKIAQEIGFPLIIKAAFGGGGRGMRVVHKAADWPICWTKRKAKPGAPFGNPAVFLEKYIPRAKHIEVQILGDRHGNVLHLHERDCSVQRRHQKVIEIAPPVALDAVRKDLCEAAVAWPALSSTTTPARSNFFTTWTSTNGFSSRSIRASRSSTPSPRSSPASIWCARKFSSPQGFALHGPGNQPAAQEEIPRMGCAVQCRVTTEDPENKFTPDYGRF
jgi:pyruvate carboxylase